MFASKPSKSEVNGLPLKTLVILFMVFVVQHIESEGHKVTYQSKGIITCSVLTNNYSLK